MDETYLCENVGVGQFFNGFNEFLARTEAYSLYENSLFLSESPTTHRVYITSLCVGENK